jgi:hypothetical protein
MTCMHNGNVVPIYFIRDIVRSLNFCSPFNAECCSKQLLHILTLSCICMTAVFRNYHHEIKKHIYFLSVRFS